VAAFTASKKPAAVTGWCLRELSGKHQFFQGYLYDSISDIKSIRQKK